MDKCWFIWINSNQEGPYSYEDLKQNQALTPDTLVWKEGFTTWLPIRKVPELKNLFKDQEESENQEFEESKAPLPHEEIALTYHDIEPPFILWLLIALLILLFVIFKLFQ